MGWHPGTSLWAVRPEHRVPGVAPGPRWPRGSEVWAAPSGLPPVLGVSGSAGFDMTQPQDRPKMGEAVLRALCSVPLG